MNPVVLLQKRLEAAPPNERAMISQFIAKAQRKQERNKSRFIRYFVAQGLHESCPETHYRAEVMAGMR